MASEVALGIDLGTTNTCVCVYRHNIFEVIPNSYGYLVTPSYVCFANDERHVGDAAKNKSVFHPKNTIFSAKRLIGRKFNDPVIQENMKHWPFEVINDDSKPKYKVITNNEEKTYYPEEICAMILRYVKEAAEKYLEMPVTNCVITIPAYFGDSQRQATVDAGKLANLNVMKIINEPTAAGISHGLLNNHISHNVLIYDLGGGTFDVSVLKIVGSSIKVLATDGNNHLGGEDFDTEIMKYIMNVINNNRKDGVDINERDLKRLRSICEKAKILLSSTSKASINLEAASGFDINYELTRERFEEINAYLFKSTINTITNCLKKIKLNKMQINEVILVGGSTKIPYIQNMVSEYFNGKILNKSLDPDQAVAQGAAIQASMLQNKNMKINILSELTIKDITSFSLGIRLKSGEVDNIIPKNSSIPCKKYKIYYPSTIESTTVNIEIYEGEDRMANDNSLLGKFTLKGFKAIKDAKSEINVTFEIDENSILDVTGVENHSGLKKQISINMDKGLLTENRIESIQSEEEEIRKRTAIRKRRISLMDKLKKRCNETIDREEQNTSNNSKINQILIHKCEDILNWVDENPNASSEEILKKTVEFTTYCQQKNSSRIIY